MALALSLVDVAAEVVLLAGGGRAILLQVANPAIGRAVATHSDFASRPLDRLKATMTYVYAVVYGTPEEVRLVRRRVNAAHAPVRQKARGGEPGYSAFDPHLQLWVTATLYETATDLYERIFGTLDEASADRLYREYEAIGAALQLPPGLWPSDRTAFQRYWQDQLGALAVDAESRRVAADLLYPRSPRWLWALMPLARLTTAGLLPTQLRRAYGLPWGPARRRRFDLWMRAVRLLYPRLPVSWRFALRDRYLAAVRREVRD
jgi:uncharacterized protein (DUF2236 family)